MWIQSCNLPIRVLLWEQRENFSRVFLWKTGGIRAWPYGGFVWFMVLPVLPCCKRRSSSTTDFLLRCCIPWGGDLDIGGAVRVDGEPKPYLPKNKHKGQNANIIYKTIFFTGPTDTMRLQTKIKSRNNILPSVRKARNTTFLTQN